MKQINNYIQEKLKLNKEIILKNQKRQIQRNYTKFPETTNELIKMIDDEISINGYYCSLNHIDVSKITDLGCCFYDSSFDGDISKWDVSNCKNMCEMFLKSSFTGKNGDISGWDVSNVENMNYMFKKSDFNSDISDWELNPKCRTYGMFAVCDIKKEYIPVIPDNKSDIYNTLPF